MKLHYSSAWRFKELTFSSPSQRLCPHPQLPSMSAVYFYRPNNCSPALLCVSVIHNLPLDVFYTNIFVHFDSRLNPSCCYHCARFQVRFHIIAKGTYYLRLFCPSALLSACIISAFTIQIKYNLILEIITWVISKVLHTVRFLFKSKFILQNTFTGLQCNLHCALSQRSNVWASLVFLSGRFRC